MISDTDWTLLVEKLDAIDKRLNTLENEVKELKPSYTPWQSQDPDAPYYRPVKESWPTDFTKWGTFPKRAVLERPCIFDSLPPEDRMKPMGISCGCPKCSLYCLGGGSLQYVGPEQGWRLSTVNEDVEE